MPDQKFYRFSVLALSIVAGTDIVRSIGNMAPAKGHFAILYFAAAATYTARSTEELPAPVQARNLFAQLEKRYPGISAKVLDSCAVTVNLEYIDMDGDDATQGNLVIKEGDEVAIIPPVSSG